MEIIVGKTAGFCFGVQNAVTKTMEEVNKTNHISCLGELVHNTQVTNELKEAGVEFIDNIEEAKNKVIIRAHGVTEETYKKAKDMNLEVIDLTCPKVLHIHNIAKEYSKNGYFIILTGKIDHPETIGTVSFCGTNYYIIENELQVEEAIEMFKKSRCSKLLVISQTTYSMEKFGRIIENLKQKLGEENIEVKNTICSATKQRQIETEEISKQVETMIIVGGKHSSNTNKLYEIAKKYCSKVLFVETEDEINKENIEGTNRIGIMAGASTHRKSIDKVLEKLQKIC